MDIRQMTYFKTIVEQGTISKAAKVLHMAQPPLSMQLKQLENELEVTLIKRNNRQIELTQAGQLFYKRCLQILDLTEIARNEIRQSYHEVLRIGITSSNVALIQHPKIKAFIASHHHLSYTIHEGSTYEMLDLLLSHNIDLGIVRTPFDSSLVNAIYLQKEPMAAIGIQDYFLTEKNSMSDFKDVPLIIHRRYLQLITDYCLNQQYQINLKVCCDDSRTSHIWAASGIGVAIVPMSSLSLEHDPSLIAVPLKDEALYTGIALITRKNEKMSASLTQFIAQFQ